MTSENAAILIDYAKNADLDAFFYSGPMETIPVDSFLEQTITVATDKPGAALFLTTFGGDPHAAYRLARFFKQRYKRFRLVVGGQCKSAGTLVAIGADELAMGPFGQLGPLDVQVTKPNEFLPRSSGLDTLQTMAVLQAHSFQAWELCMLQICSHSGGTISAKLACEVAAQLVGRLFEPIGSQIDPHRVAEIERLMQVASAYGSRLMSENLKPDTLEKLVSAYPAHGFVIDRKEAAELFKNVDRMNDAEKMVAATYWHLIKVPADETVSCDLIRLAEKVLEDNKITFAPGEKGDDKQSTDRKGSRTDDAGDRGTAGTQPDPETRSSGAADN